MDGMERLGPEVYGERIADLYDDVFSGAFDTEGAVKCLAELAGAGPVLELGIGTGRVALPLASRGIAVHGIDASPAIVERLRAKPGGDTIPVTIGDFADVAVDGRYALVVLLFNTLFALIDPDDQRRCFANVAPRIDDGGRFVVDAFVPDPSLYDETDKRLGLRRVTSDHAFLEASVHDPATQRVDTLQLRIGEDGIRTWPVQLRYSYPAELDAMAESAGLALEHRWSDWHRSPFTDESVQHVSVYRRP